MISRITFRVGLILLLTGLGGCGEDYGQLVQDARKEANLQVETLRTRITEGKIRNALVVQTYAETLAEDRPKMAKLAAEFGKEGSTDGLAFKALVDRLAAVELAVDDEKAADQSLDELARITAAADPEVFDDALIDVANVLADLSDGKLPRLKIAKSKEAPAAGSGSHLVGNPTYGRWASGSSGLYWVWFAGFSPYRSMFFTGSPYYYNHWYSGRSWSYYNDVGRHYYGGANDNRRWSEARRANPNVKPKSATAPLKSRKRLSTYGRVQDRRPGDMVKRASAYSRGDSRSRFAASSRTAKGSAAGGGRSRGK